MSVTLPLLRGFLAAVLIAAAVGKVRNRSSWLAFLSVLDELLPNFRRRVPSFAASTVALELVVAAALIVMAVPARLALSAFMLVMLVFTCALLRIIGLGSARSCACFGASPDKAVAVGAVARNLALLALALGGAAVAGPAYWFAADARGSAISASTAGLVAVAVLVSASRRTGPPATARSE